MANLGLPNLKKSLIGVSAAAALAGVALIAPYEGLVLKTYKDPIGILTYCRGETISARPGLTYTEEQCNAIFADRIKSFEKSVSGCLPNYSSLPTPVQASVLSITYNVGTGAMCKSTMFKLLSKGDIKAACEQFPLWNKAGGKVLPGLTKRRASEMAFCLKGVL